MPKSQVKEKKSNKNARTSHGAPTKKASKGGSGYKGKIDDDGPSVLDAGDPNASEDEEPVEEKQAVGRSCNACGSEIGVKLCARCKSVGYCSRECQKSDWAKGHKAACVVGSNKLANTKFVHFPPQDLVMFPGDDRFKTYDNDECLGGKKAPDCSSLVYLTDASRGKFTKGKPAVFLFWAQYHKPGYKFLPFYSALAAKFKGVHFVAVSTDPTADYPQKFLDDPNKKYAKGPLFTTTIAVAHDNNGILKKAYGEILNDTLSLPHAFVVDAKGVLVWKQDHSELGATVPNYMHDMEAQLDLLIEGKPLNRVGDRVFAEQEEEEEEGDEMEMDTGDMGDMFGF